jgi:hypothetical protein
MILLFDIYIYIYIYNLQNITVILNIKKEIA